MCDIGLFPQIQEWQSIQFLGVQKKIEIANNCRISSLRSYCGGEYTSKDLFCKQRGIDHELTTTYF